MHADRNTAIALAAVLTVWFFASLIAVKGLYSQETAAWVQAVGAIAAIVATAYFAMLPLRQREADRKARQIDLINEISTAGQLVVLSLDSQRQALHEGNSNMFRDAVRDSDPLERSALESLCELPATSWPSTLLYLRGRQLLAAAETFADAARNASSTPQGFGSSEPWLRRKSQRLQVAFDRFRDLISNYHL